MLAQQGRQVVGDEMECVRPALSFDWDGSQSAIVHHEQIPAVLGLIQHPIGMTVLRGYCTLGCISEMHGQVLVVVLIPKLKDLEHRQKSLSGFDFAIAV